MSRAPPHFACRFEIRTTDPAAARGFCACDVRTDLPIDTSGPDPMIVVPTAGAGTVFCARDRDGKSLGPFHARA